MLTAHLKGTETPPSCPSTPGSISAQQGLNKRAPLFITVCTFFTNNILKRYFIFILTSITATKRYRRGQRTNCQVRMYRTV